MCSAVKATASNLIGRLSVRSRIEALVVIPFVGFLAIGATYLYGEQTIRSTITNTDTSIHVTAVSGALKAALSAMRESAKDFAITPLSSSRKVFEGAYRDANIKSQELGERDSSAEVKSRLKAIANGLKEAKTNFDRLTQIQEQVGVNIATGIQGDVYLTAQSVDRRLNDLLAELPPSDGIKLVVPWMMMRIDEKNFMLYRVRESVDQFTEQFTTFNAALTAMPETNELKKSLQGALSDYHTAFEKLVTVVGPNKLFLSLIIETLQSLSVIADEIVATELGNQERATKVLSTFQGQLREIIITLGVVAIMLGIVVNFFIGRGIALPVVQLAKVMGRLANGDTSVNVNVGSR